MTRETRGATPNRKAATIRLLRGLRSAEQSAQNAVRYADRSSSSEPRNTLRTVSRPLDGPMARGRTVSAAASARARNRSLSRAQYVEASTLRIVGPLPSTDHTPLRLLLCSGRVGVGAGRDPAADATPLLIPGPTSIGKSLHTRIVVPRLRGARPARRDAGGLGALSGLARSAECHFCARPAGTIRS
jgi:hypothetical protein